MHLSDSYRSTLFTDHCGEHILVFGSINLQNMIDHSWITYTILQMWMPIHNRSPGTCAVQRQRNIFIYCCYNTNFCLDPGIRVDGMHHPAEHCYKANRRFGKEFILNRIIIATAPCQNLSPRPLVFVSQIKAVSNSWKLERSDDWHWA